MGIPSYYKRLLDSVKGLLRKTHPGSIDWLWMDFNCMIYHCLRRPTMQPYMGENNREEWEEIFIGEIARYLGRVVREVNPTKGVYIGIDGVVPMAKMRQQRLRRFKSAWLVEMGLAEGQEDKKERWDTNAITPGTEFMEKLRRKLVSVCDEKRWILSSSDESGEGEHKIMAQWRTGKYNGSYAVYGLDADLIVLSLLNQKNNSVWLFREVIEDGEIVRDAVGDEFFNWFSIDALRDHLQMNELGGKSIEEYCFAMSVLGNDFLPSSLSYKMREDGHTILLKVLRELETPLLTLDGSISEEGLKKLFIALAKDEEKRILQFITKKIHQGKLYEDLPVGDNNWPLTQIPERILLNCKDLHHNWQNIYRTTFLGEIDKQKICKEYLYGIQWIWAYYIGNYENICYNWNYPWSVPPLWSWLVEDTIKLPQFPDRIAVRGQDIRPKEQLCLVLPQQSWNLLYGAKEAKFRKVAPWFFPTSFGFNSLGKRFFWECEPEIPVPSIWEVKKLLE